MEQFFDIKQTGLVKDYWDEFECLSVYLPLISEKIMMKTFAKRLKKGIKAELSRGTFKDLRDLMDGALRTEKIMQAVYKSYHEQYLKEEKPPHSTYKQMRIPTHPRLVYKQAWSFTGGKQMLGNATSGQLQQEGVTPTSTNNRSAHSTKQ